MNLEHLEVVGRHAAGAQLDRLGPAGQRHGITGLGGQEVENRVVLLPVEEVQRRDDVALEPRRLFHYADDAIGPFVGERLQEQGIEEAEDCGVGANTNGKRQDGDRRETRALTKGSPGMAEIPEQ